MHLPLILLIGLASILGSVNSRGVAGNIKLVMMKTNQYWFSTSSPYAPVLNFYLSYQYCRNLGLQLATLETKDEVDAVALYLTTSSEGSEQGIKDYWTSGNRLGADTWLWMSNGEQMNATFIAENGLQQRQYSQTASPRHCLSLRAVSTRRTIFTPEVCERSLPFICEQIRCLSYYYPTVEFPEPGTGLEFQNGLRSDAEVINNGANATSTSSASTDPPLPAGTSPGKMRRLLDSEPVIKNHYFLPQSSKYANRNTQQTTALPPRRYLTLRPPMPSVAPVFVTTTNNAGTSETEAISTTEMDKIEETSTVTVTTKSNLETTTPPKNSSEIHSASKNISSPFKKNAAFIEVEVGTHP